MSPEHHDHHGQHRCQPGKPTPRPGLAQRPREKELITALLAGLDGPGPKVSRVVVGGRFVGVEAGQGVGLASTLGAAPGPDDQATLERLEGAPLARAASLLLEDSPLLASVGLAALNAACPAPAQASPLGAGNLLNELAAGRKVVVMGDFPFTAELAQAAGELHLLELRPGADTPPPEEWEGILASCEVAALTATALLTRALAWAMDSAPRALKVVIGPSTPWSPVLFDWGADILAGSRVVNPGPVLEAVGQGLPFKRIKKAGVEALTWRRTA